MKTTESTRKKLELRERFLKYARSHAVDSRIPTVAELRKALGVTNYMLLNCMNELVREGFLCKKSRRDGTFLSNGPKHYVIGLVLDNGAVNEYVNIPAWLGGVCSAFRGHGDFILRTVQLSRLGNLPDAIRGLGLDAVIVNPERYVKGFDEFTPQVRSKILFSILNYSDPEQVFPAENTLSIDHDYWPREYVRAAVRKGCRSFLLFAPPDPICRTMIDEMEKLGLEWHPECLIADPAKLKKKLPQLIRKYHPDAIRCTGSNYPFFARTAKEFPEFRPLIPYYATDHVRESMRKEYPWLNLFFLFESLDDFNFRFGLETGRKAMEMILTGKPFPSVRLRMERSPETDSGSGEACGGNGKKLFNGVS